MQRKSNNINVIGRFSERVDWLGGRCCPASGGGLWLMAGTDQPSPWWAATRHADRKPFLMARGAITRAVRAWFDEQGFAEVETGILQVSPGNETHLHAPRTEIIGGDGTRATRYLRQHSGKRLAIAGVCRALAVGERTLARRFKASLGMSPLSYLQSQRVARARQLLESSTLPLERIVEQCGYEDVSSFRKLFARQVGMTPREYRLRFGND